MQKVTIREVSDGWKIDFDKPINMGFHRQTAAEARDVVTKKAEQLAEQNGGISLLELTWESTTRIGKMVASALSAS